MQDSVSEGDCVEFLFFFSSLSCSLHVEGCALINLIAVRWWFVCKLDQTFGDVGFVKLALALLSDLVKSRSRANKYEHGGVGV